MQATSRLCQTLRRSLQYSVPKPIVSLLLVLPGLQDYWSYCLLVLSLHRLLVHPQVLSLPHLLDMAVYQATALATKSPLKSGANQMKYRGVTLRDSATVMLLRILTFKSSRVT